jgi:hypothetical protein
MHATCLGKHATIGLIHSQNLKFHAGNKKSQYSMHFYFYYFSFSVCKKPLAGGGFFVKEGDFYCASDYQQLFGTKCVACGEYVEGEVITAMGNTYHQQCFVCTKCKTPFPPGEKVLYDGSGCLCQQCATNAGIFSSTKEAMRECAGCNEPIGNSQVLLALDKTWHVYCFKCHHCDCQLPGEYMNKDGLPYCEKDYQALFGVQCHVCGEFVTGKVIQAGEQYYHPACAKCSKCGENFGEGEEMFTQGTDVWHPSCGSAPQVIIESQDAPEKQMIISDDRSSNAYVSSAVLKSPLTEITKHTTEVQTEEMLPLPPPPVVEPPPITPPADIPPPSPPATGPAPAPSPPPAPPPPPPPPVGIQNGSSVQSIPSQQVQVSSGITSVRDVQDEIRPRKKSFLSSE